MPGKSPQPNRTALARALTAHGIHGAVRAGHLIELPRNGLMHRHWRVGRTGTLLRVPLSAAAQLDRQAETFRRMAASRHVPTLYATLPPQPGVPFGALVVGKIVGRAPRVPGDFKAIAAALAAIHALPMPPPAGRPPLESPDEPFAATLAVIERNLAAGAKILGPTAGAALAAELGWARGFAAANTAALRAAPRALVLTDAHPRNFIIDRNGRAIAVDLEKALYGAPGIDLAHAMLPAAIAWGRAGERVTDDGRADFVAAYFARRGDAAMREIAPLLEPLRRLTALRTAAAFAAIRATGADRKLAPAARTVARRAIAAALG